MHFNGTEHPTAGWTVRQLLEGATRSITTAYVHISPYLRPLPRGVDVHTPGEGIVVESEHLGGLLSAGTCSSKSLKRRVD
jgi:hypothetical protein